MDGKKQQPCPMCAEAIPADAVVCPYCSSTLKRRCPACAESIAADAVVCPFCKSPVEREGAGPPARAAAGPSGEEREIVTLILLTLVTCGIYGIVVTYKIGHELNAHRRRDDIRPGLDVVLTIVTCGLWGLYLMYAYPRALEEVQREEGQAPSQIMLPCLLLAIFGIYVASLAILQNELNTHWRSHRRGE